MGIERQNIQLRLAFPEGDWGEAPGTSREGTEMSVAVCAPESPAEDGSLMEEVCERENLTEALKRVRANRGSPGVDGMRVEELVHALDDGLHELAGGGVVSVLVMDTTLTPLRLSMDLKATACSRFLVNLENFQTRITSKGALGWLPSSIISLNWGLSATRPLSASSTYLLATE